MKVFVLSLGRVTASVISVLFLVRENYWAALAALVATLVAKIFYVNVVRSSVKKKFAETLLSTTEITVTFIVIAGFGYAGVLYWGIVAPLLLTTYLIGYMSLRVGIATGKSAPQASILENLVLPLCLITILLLDIVSPDAKLAGLSLANCVGTLLFVGFFALAVQRARIAYTNLLVVKS